MSSLQRRLDAPRLPNWFVQLKLSPIMRPASFTERQARDDMIKAFRREYGLMTVPAIVYFKTECTRRAIQHVITKKGQAPDPVRLLLPREKLLGAALTTALALLFAIGSFTAPRPLMAAVPMNVNVLTEREIVSMPLFADVKSRPELGKYADPEYRYPHLSIDTGPATPVAVTFNAFIGKKVGAGMYSRYLGIEGTIPSKAMVDGGKSHERMFELKLKNNPDTTPVARGMGLQYQEMYDVQRTRMTLAQFVEGVDMVDRESYASIDWSGLCADSKLQLGADSCRLLQKLVGNTTGEQQVAYAMTELLGRDPTGTGVWNAWVLDQGFRNLGREFWDLTPAGGDPLASGGLWQFTSLSVGAFDDKDDGPQTGFVTIVSRHAGLKVPESFLDLKRTEHERAAFYFRVANLAFLVRDAAKNAKAYATLKKVSLGGHSTDWLAFVATSHHAQNKVRKDFAMKWLKDGAKKPFTTYLRGRFMEYGKRTLINYPGLIRYLRNPEAALASAGAYKKG